MTDVVRTALITGGLLFLGNVITTLITNRSAQLTYEGKVATYQAVTNEKLETLTTEVRRHNNFAERIPALEGQVAILMKHYNA